jgi:glycine oxidase
MRVVIVGGGVIGLSIAFRCSQRGVDVTIVDPAPWHGASWVAGGMLAPVAEAYRGEEAVTALGLASARRWPDFVAELEAAAGTDPGYTRAGTLVVARDGDDVGQLADLHELQAQAGMAAERVSSREARRIEPALAPSVRGALWLPDDHQVDNRLLVRALDAACRRREVRFVHDTAVEIRTQSVATATGDTIDADAVVVATGAQAAPIVVDGEPLHPPLPVRPVKGQIVRVRATRSAVFPTHTVRGVDVYVIPRAHGEIAIGATSEEKGFDLTVTAGAVLELLRDAWELLPGMAEAEFVEVCAGHRPGTPDNAPIIGRVGAGADAGPFVATGHYRNGVLLAPITADAVAALVFGDDAELAALVEPFSPARFTARQEVGA